MSRIGRLPVALPKGVTFEVRGQTMTAKGPKGTLSRAIPGLVEVQVSDAKVQVARVNDSKPSRERHGLTRTLVQNLVTGVAEGFTRKLEIQGVGYRAEVKGRDLVLTLGYSHPVVYPMPPGIDIKVEKNEIVVFGADKEAVGQAAANIRGFRSPDAYKGKGIRYSGEVVRLKAGKSGK